MKTVSRAAAAALFAFALASPCWAGQVRIEIRNGLVSLSAKDASVREVLTEWARVGQTRIVNAERVPYGVLNLELNGVPEAKALDILLRSVAGYLAAPRAASMTIGSRYDRIVIMPVARPAAGGASPAVTTTGPQQYEQRRMYQPQPSLMVDDQDEPVQPQPQPQQPSPGGTAYPGASQPGVMTQQPPSPVYQYPQQGQQPGVAQPGMPQPGMAQPGMAQPGMSQPGVPGNATPAAPRPGMTTPGAKPPGTPGGPGGD